LRKGCTQKSNEHQAHGGVARGAFEIDGFPHSGLQSDKKNNKQKNCFVRPPDPNLQKLTPSVTF
jgi:hypothetical protein